MHIPKEKKWNEHAQGRDSITRPEIAGWGHSSTQPHLASWLCFLPRETSRSYMPSSVLLTGDWAQLSPHNPRGPRNRTALLLRPDSHSWESRKEFLRAHVFQFQPRMRASTDHEWSELQKGKNQRARLTIPKDCYYTLCQDTLCGIHTAEVSNHFQYYFHTLAFHLQFETSCTVVMSSRIKSDGKKKHNWRTI